MDLRSSVTKVLCFVSCMMLSPLYASYFVKAMFLPCMKRHFKRRLCPSLLQQTNYKKNNPKVLCSSHRNTMKIPMSCFFPGRFLTLLTESQYLTEQMPQRYTSVSGNKHKGRIRHAHTYPQHGINSLHGPKDGWRLNLSADWWGDRGENNLTSCSPEKLHSFPILYKRSSKRHCKLQGTSITSSFSLSIGKTSCRAEFFPKLNSR